MKKHVLALATLLDAVSRELREVADYEDTSLQEDVVTELVNQVDDGMFLFEEWMEERTA